MDKPKVQPYGVVLSQIGENRWRLEKTVQEWGVRVPVGFETDLASVPRVLWSLVPPFGRYSKAAIVHDRLYNIQDRPKKKADKLFLRAMKDLGVPFWKRKVMYRFVRLFGRYR